MGSKYFHSIRDELKNIKGESHKGRINQAEKALNPITISGIWEMCHDMSFIL